MKPEKEAKRLLGVTRSKAKMYEYNIPEESHINIEDDRNNLPKLFPLSIGLLGEYAARINSEDVDQAYLDSIKKSLMFSAHFFDAYFKAKLEQNIDSYFVILSSASYYLCDLPGSSKVLAKDLSIESLDLKCEGLDCLLLWLLKEDWSVYFKGAKSLYGDYIDSISQALVAFFEKGTELENLFENIKSLREVVYTSGTPRELLFSDIICAIIKKRIKNSTWNSIPQYSNISLELWRNTLQKEDFIRELWPSQHLLGKQGVFCGKSAVIQMPTSAGKTKAAEIIIRSAFLSERTSLAVIVAPFRALCHDIKDDLTNAFNEEDISIDELSDVFQEDFNTSDFIGNKQIIVVTPEKLLYVIRQDPSFASYIGLLIYDEGHQFDSGSRGITYELLLTSLKSVIPEGAQTLLISAVMSNANDINNWLNEETESEVIIGNNINPTYRSIAFLSWINNLRQLKFIDPETPDKEEFFVPRIITLQKLQLRGKERIERIFPAKEGPSLALYLGLKLVSNGGIAIFCGTKRSASSLCSNIIEKYDRGLTLEKPITYSDPQEIDKLYRLHFENLGRDSSVSRAARIGIFVHHNNIPHGIRFSVEYAMKNSLAKFVICTSTLAQGVNLPLRYLIIASTQQGKDEISVRDFHNLIGRAGRAGMYTEGSIIFANNSIYDSRRAEEGRWRWKKTKELLNAKNSEHCASSLLRIVEPIHNGQNGNFRRIINTKPLDFINYYIEGVIDDFIDYLENKVGFERNVIEIQVNEKINILSAIESYLLSYFEEGASELEDASELAKGTLAYSLSNDDEKKQIIALFNLLAENIHVKTPEAYRKKIFGKTLYGLNASIKVETWVKDNITQLTECNNQDELIDSMWSILFEMIKNSSIKNCDKPCAVKNIVKEWTAGKPFYELLEVLQYNDAKLKAGTRFKDFSIDNVVDICENGLAYDGSLLVGAIIEIIKATYDDSDTLIENLRLFQKKIKYGLESPIAILIYELGFSDRIVSQKLSTLITPKRLNKKWVKKELIYAENEIRAILNNYPTYFTEKYNTLLIDQ